MMTIGVFAVLGAVLFGLAFMTKRRFGVLGLALAAGSLLSSLWATSLVGVIEAWAPHLAGVVMAGYVAAGLVLLPAALLLFSGPSYAGKHGRVTGAVLFAVFAVVLVAEPLGAGLVLDAAGRTLYDALHQYQAMIVTGGIVLAILDLLVVHAAGGHTKAKH